MEENVYRAEALLDALPKTPESPQVWIDEDL